MLLGELIDNCPEAFAKLDVKGFTSDSRKIMPGFVFVCIKGPVNDGHSFADNARKNGASLIICEHSVGAENQMIVSDTKSVYAVMCSRWFHEPQKKLDIFGVTGTNGKTSVSYMLKAILEENKLKVGLIGTIQHMIGDTVVSSANTTPGLYELYELFDRMVKAGCKACVMEVSSHALDQGRVEGVHFKTAMFTNLTRDHLDYHKTMEAYLAAKKKLFFMADTAVVNYDDPSFAEITDGIPSDLITYSLSSDESTYTAKNVRYDALKTEFEFVGYETISRVRLQIGGSFTAANAMCALTAAVASGYDESRCVEALSKMTTVSGRCESVPTDRDFSVIIDYAHTPDGLENILKTFRDCERNRLIVLFGCGGDRDKTKRPIMGKIAADNADYVIITSDNPRTEDPEAIIKDIVAGLDGCKTPYSVIPDRTEAIRFALECAEKNDIIVLAGKGHETYQILADGKIHFDEREIVGRILNENK